MMSEDKSMLVKKDGEGEYIIVVYIYICNLIDYI